MMKKALLAIQKQTGADLLVYSCRTTPADQKGLCSWWEKKGLAQPDVQRIVDDYIKVRFTFPLGKDDQGLADRWKINTCPVVLVVQTNGWRERVAVYDWPDNGPKLKEPRAIVQAILDASAPRALQRNRAGAVEAPSPAEQAAK